MNVRLIFRGLCVLLFGWLASVPNAGATHLVGGDLRYIYLGNSTYEIILEVYKDCNSPTAFDLPSNVKLGMIDAVSRVVIDSFYMVEMDSVPVIIESQDPCAPPPFGLCYSHATYTCVKTLPVSANGLVLMWGRCCRNESITNLNNPEATGMILSCEIPPIANNSPAFNKALPVYTCVGKPFSFDQGATDADGDSLAYFLVLPYTAGSSGNPFPNPTGIFQPVTFAPGYTSQSPLGATSPLSLNKATGQLDMLPADIGQFVFGIGVQEFRGGASLGTLRRDVQINVVACPVNNPPKISLSLTGEVRGDTMIFRAGFSRCQELSVVDVNGPGFGQDSVFMEVLSPIPGAVQPATITYLPGPAPRQAQLCWTPTCTETDLVGAVAFRIRDNNNCPSPNIVEKTFFYKVLPLTPAAPNLRCVSVVNPGTPWMDLTWVLPPADSVANPVGIIVERDTGNGFFPLDTLPWGTTTWRDLQADLSQANPIGYRLLTLANCPVLVSSPPGNAVFNLRTRAAVQGNRVAEITWDSLVLGATPAYVLESQDLQGGTRLEGTFATNTYTFIPCKFEGTMRVTLQDPLTGCRVLAAPTDTFAIDNSGIPPSVSLCGVSVENGFPVISWPVIPGFNAFTYTLFRGERASGDFTPLVETRQDSFSTWTDTTADATARPWCYFLQITDPCGNVMQTETHCSVFLEGEAATGAVSLTWSPYQLTTLGRDVQEYGLDMMSGEDGPARIAWLAPTVLQHRGERSFTQAPGQCYRIAASTEGVSGCPVREYYSNEVCFVFPPFVVLPTAFTPNNDSKRVNDSLRFAAFFYREIRVQVFDRNGHEIWATSTPNVFWDGYLGTALAPEGGYYLRVVTTSYTGEVKSWDTPVILLR